MDIKTYLDIINIYKNTFTNPNEKDLINILNKYKNIDAVKVIYERDFYFLNQTKEFATDFNTCDIIKIIYTNIPFKFIINNKEISIDNLIPIFLFDNIKLIFESDIKDKLLHLKYIGYKLNNIPYYEFKIYNKIGIDCGNILIKDNKIIIKNVF